VAFVTDLALQGELSVGAIVLTLSLGAQVNGQLAELADNATWFSQTARATGRYRWLSDYVAGQEEALAPGPPGPLPVPDRLRDGIVFEGVSFAYPGTDRVVLGDVDLRLPAGSTVAIVGENGAGKTTLVKLLLRFYEPTAGRITVDGVDLTRFPIDDWRRLASAAFQDFARFQLVARHSVGVGHLPALVRADGGARPGSAGFAGRADRGPAGARDRAGGAGLARALARGGPATTTPGVPTAAAITAWPTVSATSAGSIGWWPRRSNGRRPATSTGCCPTASTRCWGASSPTGSSCRSGSGRRWRSPGP
jgi:hypothetical protein